MGKRPAQLRRGFLGAALAAIIFGSLSMPLARIYFLTLRETLKLAEHLGIMDPKGALGGQVMGFNYQREPAWVYSVGQALGAGVAYVPPLVVSLVVFHRVAIGRLGATGWGRCGKCGRSIAGSKEPRCGACGAEF